MLTTIDFMRLIPILLSILILSSCSTNYKIIQIHESNSLIPEGIAVHPDSKEIYLSSINEDKLINANRKGSQQKIVLERSQNGYSFGLGLDFFADELYALSSLNRENKSILSITNILSQSLHTYEIAERDSSQFNDLAIDKIGNAYITDSKNHEIFFFDNDSKNIIPYLKSEQFYYPNGITLNDQGSKLFVSSYSHGLRIIDTDSRKIINDIDEQTKNTGIDGLKFYEGSLYFVMNSRIGEEIVRGLYRIKLDANQTEIGELESLLVNKELLQDPTTFSIVDDWIYIIANTQLGSFDNDTQSIKSDSKLEDVRIVKFRIKNGG